MIRIVSYPITRAFTSIWVGMTLLCCAPALYAASASNIATLEFKDAGGNNVTLNSFKGRVLVVNLWATWCAPCIGEMPTLAALQGEYKDKGLVVVALSEDDSIADAIKFYKAKSITALTPFYDKDHSVWMALKARGLPTTVLIDKNGTLVKTFEGAIDSKLPELKKTIDQLIGN